MKIAVGILFIAIGVVLGHIVKARAFNRRNEHGVEMFKGYTSMTMARTVESVLSKLSFACMVFGALFLFMQFM